MQTRLSETGYRALKMLAAEQGRPLQGLVLEALNDLLRRYGKPAVVTGPEKAEKE
ncbi:ribbon-helix-helix domain-containing protein [Bradyrhizobium sp. LB13.1]